MKKKSLCALALLILSRLLLAQDIDSSNHAVQLIPVDKDVKLEVLDWGGTGRPMILLAGLGNDAHIFDGLAPKLIPSFHVYGITRRGYGLSSSPVPSDDNYSADRLGDDVLAVIGALKLDRPILVGHSIAGEELSSIGSRHPEKVAGLIYLDAVFAYAFYDPTQGNLLIDAADLRRRLGNLVSSAGPREQEVVLKEMRQSILPQLEIDLMSQEDDLAKAPEPPATFKPHEVSPIVKAILMGQQKYTSIKVPVLAICAVPHDLGHNEKDTVARSAAEARDLARTTKLADTFQRGVPSAHVVRLAHAGHYIFNSNEADVLREISAFATTLP